MVLWLDRIRGKWSSSWLKRRRSIGKGGHFEARIPPLLNITSGNNDVAIWFTH
jgi:hypothetical protein